MMGLNPCKKRQEHCSHGLSQGRVGTQQQGAVAKNQPCPLLDLGVPVPRNARK